MDVSLSKGRTQWPSHVKRCHVNHLEHDDRDVKCFSTVGTELIILNGAAEIQTSICNDLHGHTNNSADWLAINKNHNKWIN